MTIEKFMQNLIDWMKNKETGVVKIVLHEGGIRKVRIEKDVK